MGDPRGRPFRYPATGRPVRLPKLERLPLPEGVWPRAAELLSEEPAFQAAARPVPYPPRRPAREKKTVSVRVTADEAARLVGRTFLARYPWVVREKVGALRRVQRRLRHLVLFGGLALLSEARKMSLKVFKNPFHTFKVEP